MRISAWIANGRSRLAAKVRQNAGMVLEENMNSDTMVFVDGADGNDCA